MVVSVVDVEGVTLFTFIERLAIHPAPGNVAVTEYSPGASTEIDESVAPVDQSNVAAPNEEAPEFVVV